MHTQRFASRTALALVTVSALMSACGDDSPGIDRRDDASILRGDSSTGPAADGGDVPVPPGSDIDAGDGLDGGFGPDGPTPGDGGSVTPADGSVPPLGSLDAGTGGDAAAVDGADASPVAEVDAGPGTIPDRDGGPCDVVDPRFGCGIAAGDSWVTFENGLSVDRANKKAWSPIVTVRDDDALNTICSPLNLGGLEGFSLPQIEDVRTLAAGCPETVPGGSCQVDKDMVAIAEAGDCSCDEGLTGPNNGKFCRPDVPECETIWAWTHTEETGWYQHWFYDVETGSIVPNEVGVGLAVPAKGRCVRDFTEELP